MELAVEFGVKENKSGNILSQYDYIFMHLHELTLFLCILLVLQNAFLFAVDVTAA